MHVCGCLRIHIYHATVGRNRGVSRRPPFVLSHRGDQVSVCACACVRVCVTLLAEKRKRSWEFFFFFFFFFFTKYTTYSSEGEKTTEYTKTKQQGE